MGNPSGICRSWQIVTLLELLEGNAEAFWAVAGVLGQAIVRLEVDAVMADSTPGYIGSAMRRLSDHATRLNLRSSARQCQRVYDYIDGGEQVTHKRLREMLVDVLLRTGDDLEDRYFLVVPPEFVASFRQETPPFGNEVMDAFPHASEDISEAGKCLALDRSTAVVFHLMRAMESAVQALSAELGITKTDRVWGSLLSDMAAKIEAMPKGAERNKWSEGHTHLYHVKQAWRNDTMHPKQTYTFSEAKAIYEAVNVFMRHLATLVRPRPS